jgi:hypothetical protein
MRVYRSSGSPAAGSRSCFPSACRAAADSPSIRRSVRRSRSRRRA